MRCRPQPTGARQSRVRPHFRAPPNRAAAHGPRDGCHAAAPAAHATGLGQPGLAFCTPKRNWHLPQAPFGFAGAGSHSQLRDTCCSIGHCQRGPKLRHLPRAVHALAGGCCRKIGPNSRISGPALGQRCPGPRAAGASERAADGRRCGSSAAWAPAAQAAGAGKRRAVVWHGQVRRRELFDDLGDCRGSRKGFAFGFWSLGGGVLRVSDVSDASRLSLPSSTEAALRATSAPQEISNLLWCLGTAEAGSFIRRC